MSATYLLLAILAMAVVTFVTRALPVLLPQRLLQAPWLHRLNEQLPLTVLVLLVLSSLSLVGLLAVPFTHQTLQSTRQTIDNHKLIAEIIALFVVLMVYHYSRQLLLSMVVGIATINAALWLLLQMSV